MLSSLAQLQKVLQTEVGLKYANKAVIGGLPKLMTFWEPNARRDGLSDDFIRDVASRLRTYVETDQERRPAALGEILDVIKAEHARRSEAERRPEPSRDPAPQQPARPREAAPRPADDVRRDAPPARRPTPHGNARPRPPSAATAVSARAGRGPPRPRPERGPRPETRGPEEARPSQERRERPERGPATRAAGRRERSPGPDR